MIPNVKKILILVETDDGEWREANLTLDQKKIILMQFSNHCLLPLSPEIEPVEITFKEKKI